MPRDLDNPYGMEFRGRERAMRFVNPYRHIGELNPIEQLKLQRHPFEVAQAIIERYSKEGIGRPRHGARRGGAAQVGGPVPPTPGRRRLHDADQGARRGADRAPRPARSASPPTPSREGPDDSPVFGNRYADITTRQTIQLHWLRIEDIPRIWQRFREVGLTTVQACGDSARNVCCCPVSGVDADEVVEALPVARAISAFFTGNREYANLPRKFKIAVTGCLEDCARVEIDDIGLWPARPTTARSASTCWPAAASPTGSGWRRTSTSSSGPTRRSS